MGRFRERHGASVTTWPFSVRVVLTVVVLWLTVMFLAQLVLADGAVRAWWVFTLLVSAPLAWSVLRSVWSPSDEAVRDDSVATRLST